MNPTMIGGLIHHLTNTGTGKDKLDQIKATHERCARERDGHSEFSIVEAAVDHCAVEKLIPAGTVDKCREWLSTNRPAPAPAPAAPADPSSPVDPPSTEKSDDDQTSGNAAGSKPSGDADKKPAKSGNAAGSKPSGDADKKPAKSGNAAGSKR